MNNIVSVHVIRNVSLHWRTLRDLSEVLKACCNDKIKVFIYTNKKQILLTQTTFLKIMTAFCRHYRVDHFAFLVIENSDNNKIKELNEVVNKINLDVKEIFGKDGCKNQDIIDKPECFSDSFGDINTLPNIFEK